MLPSNVRQRGRPKEQVPKPYILVNKGVYEYDTKLCAVYGHMPDKDNAKARLWIPLLFVVFEALAFLGLWLVHTLVDSRDLYSWALIGFQTIHIITLSTAPAYFFARYNPLLTSNLVIFRGAAFIIDLIVLLARIIVRPPAETIDKWVVMLVAVFFLVVIDFVLLLSMGYGARWVSEYHRMRGRAISEMSATAEYARKFNAPTRGVYFVRTMLTTLSKLSFDLWSFHLVFFALYLFMFPSLTSAFLVFMFGAGLLIWSSLWAYVQLAVGTINNSDPFQSDMGMIHFPKSVEIDRVHTRAIVTGTAILCTAGALSAILWIVGQSILAAKEAPNIFVSVIYTVICVLGIFVSSCQLLVTGAMAVFAFMLNRNLKSMLMAKQERISKKAPNKIP